jgi:BirA family biotin operon repressor/biotin-[acetyl-CoA-carboxylase] ligase
MLKWPNDLLLLGRKLAGILLERSGDRVVIGFGVNLTSAPELPGLRSAALSGQVSPREFAPLLAKSFERLLELWRRSEPVFIAQAWLARAQPIGARLSVHASSEEKVRGRFDGLEADGALRLRRDDGSLEIVRAGDVSLA